MLTVQALFPKDLPSGNKIIVCSRQDSVYPASLMRSRSVGALNMLSLQSGLRLLTSNCIRDRLSWIVWVDSFITRILKSEIGRL